MLCAGTKPGSAPPGGGGGPAGPAVLSCGAPCVAAGQGGFARQLRVAVARGIGPVGLHAGQRYYQVGITLIVLKPVLNWVPFFFTRT